MKVIEVDPFGLGIVARQLTESVQIAGNVQKHHDRMAAHAEHAGHPDVTDALAHFLGKWAYGCGCLLADGETLAARLGAASHVYVVVEESIAHGIGNTPWPRQPQ